MGFSRQRPGPIQGVLLSARTRLAAVVALAVLVPAAPADAAPAPRAAAQAPDVVTQLLADRAQPRAGTRSSRATLTRQVARQRAAARARVVAYARAQRGDRYSYGASGPSSFDCSGLTQAAFRTAGIRLPRSSGAQARRGVRVSARNARPGDLIVWRGHVAVLSGRWRMVDAPGRGRRVTERAVYRRPAPQFRRLIG